MMRRRRTPAAIEPPVEPVIVEPVADAPVTVPVVQVPNISDLRAEYERLASAVQKSQRGSAEFNQLMAQKRVAFGAWYEASRK